MKQITPQQLRNVIIDGKFPFEIIKVKDLQVEFTFTDIGISPYPSLKELVQFLAKVTKCKGVDGPIFINSLPSVYLFLLQNTYMDFQFEVGCALMKAVENFVKLPESRGLWIVYTNSNPAHVLNIINDRLNIVQRRWIILNAEIDTKNKMQLIEDIFDVAKPWLDKELYTRIKEHEDATRTNAFFDDETQDARLRAKAKKMAMNKTSTKAPEGDIVIVEGGED